MADILPDDLAKRSSGELLDACGRLQEAYTAALEREAAAVATARRRLTAAAERLGKLLGPTQPKSGNLQSLREACLLTPADLVAKTPEVLQLLLAALRDVTEVAQQAALIGVEQAR
ncbi:hypothetical protein [Arachnia propionica]|uniref:hypothetical protein n=1 Tax=Arachnia propionica TaxID=1750 RepID=UPI00243053DA|nr:hypothetical protein [Arachnia propionica]